MDVGDYMKLGGALTVIVGWIVRQDRRIGRALTREEHEKICETRNKEVGEKLDVIRDDIREIREWVVKP